MISYQEMLFIANKNLEEMKYKLLLSVENQLEMKEEIKLLEEENKMFKRQRDEAYSLLEKMKSMLGDF